MVEQTYHHPIIGIVTEQQKELISQALEPSWLDEIMKRITYLTHTPITKQHLANLDQQIATRARRHRFITLPGNPHYLPKHILAPLDELWTYMEGAVSSVICRLYVQSYYLVPVVCERVFISDIEMMEAITRLQPQFPALEPESYSPNFRLNGAKSMACPDDVVATIYPIPTMEVELDPVLFEYKSSSFNHPDKKQTAANIRQPLVTPSYREVIRHAVADICGVSPDNTHLPDPLEFQVVKIAIEDSLDFEDATIDSQNGIADRRVIGMPSTRNITYFVLQRILGGTDDDKSFDNGFMPIQHQLARSITEMRAVKGLRSGRYDLRIGRG